MAGTMATRPLIATCTHHHQCHHAKIPHANITHQQHCHHAHHHTLQHPWVKRLYSHIMGWKMWPEPLHSQVREKRVPMQTIAMQMGDANPAFISQPTLPTVVCIVVWESVTCIAWGLQWQGQCQMHCFGSRPNPIRQFTGVLLFKCSLGFL